MIMTFCKYKRLVSYYIDNICPTPNYKDSKLNNNNNNIKSIKIDIDKDKSIWDIDRKEHKEDNNKEDNKDGDSLFPRPVYNPNNVNNSFDNNDTYNISKAWFDIINTEDKDKNPLDDVIEHELLPYNLLDQLAPKYEEMQRILDFLPEPSRTILLGIALSSAINSGNPVDTMNKKLTDYRKAKTRVMMLNDLAVFYGQDKAYIKEFLKFKFKQKEYYRKFNK